MYLDDHKIDDHGVMNFVNGWRQVGLGVLVASILLFLAGIVLWLEGKSGMGFLYVLGLGAIALVSGLFLFLRDKYWMRIDPHSGTVKFSHSRYSGEYRIDQLFLVIDAGRASKDPGTWFYADIYVTHAPDAMGSLGRNSLRLTKIGLKPDSLHAAYAECKAIGPWRGVIITPGSEKWRHRGWFNGIEDDE